MLENHTLQLRLMYEWTAHVAGLLAPAPESAFWRDRATLIAIEHRPLLNAIFALSALRVAMDATSVSESTSLRDSAGLYFGQAKRSVHEDLQNAMNKNVEATYLASVLLSFFALASLAGSMDVPRSDLELWIQTSMVVQSARSRLLELRGTEILQSLGLPYGNTRLTEERQAYDRNRGKPFTHLLTFAAEHENMTTEDEETYVALLGCLSVLFHVVNDRVDSPARVGQRLAALPSTLPAHLSTLVAAKTPRALVMLAHAIALMQLVEHEVTWLRGIANRQVRQIYENIPLAWKQRMSWPMMIVEGNVRTLTTGVEHGEPVVVAMLCAPDIAEGEYCGTSLAA
ncbi:hypothetical protein LTR56_005567 [Elasticomyces elasticus]|nr:hypothetical protein LTR22_017154 [Elasticomyces elasticus]KAK3651759.1 hypothetical protein LTR56_005567 [Elasticomyces elasticus]KAK4913336.1 hypothetical protein LTR49_018317 [Elasticomyces elasticus]KAK5769142.1 hypothetical protein LTS12_000493 [Elasticomyces elasticus]